MKHIIVDFNLFIMKQNIMVYSEGECLKQIEVPLDFKKICSTLYSLSKEYSIYHIDLCGPEDISNKVKENFCLNYDCKNYTFNNITRGY